MPVLKPPVQRAQHHIERMARNLEKTMARRRRLIKELRAVDQQVRTERKLLRDVIADATASIDRDLVAIRPDVPHGVRPSDSRPQRGTRELPNPRGDAEKSSRSRKRHRSSRRRDGQQKS
jgi:hypothetical protein